ncbi:MAG TPA: methylamine dehydrogenase light chain [Steroidobacteraceae bacterium]|nr:methylamine dehydrogenase light chain [Steroidobacteraceae bacterium]
MKWLDAFAENSARALARRSSRRSVLGGLGSLLLGAAAVPLLPVARGAEVKRAGAASNPHWNDPSSCDYWRHCAIDGYICSCCGGSQSMCPPGTDMSPVTWIGTCHNPGDGKDYVVSYNDCCGKSSCGRCFCNRNEGDSPMFQPGHSNDYNWCSGNSKANIPYHCSTARIVGVVG